MSDTTPEFSRKDIVIVESPAGYDAEPFPGVILEVTDDPAGEQEAQHSDGSTNTLAEHYGDAVAESDPVYRVRDLVLVDGELKPGTTTYTIPEGAMRLRGGNDDA